MSLRNEVADLIEQGVGTTNTAGVLLLAAKTSKVLKRIAVAEFLHEHEYHETALRYLLEGSNKNNVCLLLCGEYKIRGGLPPLVKEVLDELRKELDNV